MKAFIRNISECTQRTVYNSLYWTLAIYPHSCFAFAKRCDIGNQFWFLCGAVIYLILLHTTCVLHFFVYFLFNDILAFSQDYIFKCIRRLNEIIIGKSVFFGLSTDKTKKIFANFNLTNTHPLGKKKAIAVMSLLCFAPIKVHTSQIYQIIYKIKVNFIFILNNSFIN